MFRFVSIYVVLITIFSFLADYMTRSTLPAPTIATNSVTSGEKNAETAPTDCGPVRTAATFTTTTLSVVPATWTFRTRPALRLSNPSTETVSPKRTSISISQLTIAFKLSNHPLFLAH